VKCNTYALKKDEDPGCEAGIQICNGHFLTFLLQEKGKPKKINEGGKGRKQIKVNIEKVPLAMYGGN